MMKEEIAQGLAEFAKMAYVDPQNPETGFLTRNRVNPLSKEQIVDFYGETEEIINQFVQLLDDTLNGIVPSDYDCGMLFQYVFDKITEATYKMIMDEEIDTQFILHEVYDGYAPDLPEYIQLKLTNVVPKLGIIHSSMLQYLTEKDIITANLTEWMPAYLMVAAAIGIEFAQEIDLDDDSEMQAYLNSEE